MRTDFLILMISTITLITAVIFDELINTKQKRKVKRRKRIDKKK